MHDITGEPCRQMPGGVGRMKQLCGVVVSASPCGTVTQTPSQTPSSLIASALSTFAGGAGSRHVGASHLPAY